MLILLHTSKTMRTSATNSITATQPALIEHAQELQSYLKSLNIKELARSMKISEKLAVQVSAKVHAWQPIGSGPAAGMFLGDIFSGLQVQTWSKSDWEYARDNLRILSGLYGVLKPTDSIDSYRLEMGYRFSKEPYKNLYKFWGNTISEQLPFSDVVVNLSAVEYSKAITSYVDGKVVIAPKFLTVNEKLGEPTFVVVHAKIARGAFARWMIANKVNDASQLTSFNELGYNYSQKMSSPLEPVFICNEFGGIGLSVRLT